MYFTFNRAEAFEYYKCICYFRTKELIIKIVFKRKDA